MNGELIVGLAEQIWVDPDFTEVRQNLIRSEVNEDWDEQKRLDLLEEEILTRYIHGLGDGIELLEHAKQVNDLHGNSAIESSEDAVDALRQYVWSGVWHEILRIATPLRT